MACVRVWYGKYNIANPRTLTEALAILIGPPRWLALRHFPGDLLAAFLAGYVEGQRRRHVHDMDQPA